jgi:hypothetical protein
MTTLRCAPPCWPTGWQAGGSDGVSRASLFIRRQVALPRPRMLAAAHAVRRVPAAASAVLRSAVPTAPRSAPRMVVRSRPGRPFSAAAAAGASGGSDSGSGSAGGGARQRARRWAQSDSTAYLFVPFGALVALGATSEDWLPSALNTALDGVLWIHRRSTLPMALEDAFAFALSFPLGAWAAFYKGERSGRAGTACVKTSPQPRAGLSENATLSVTSRLLASQQRTDETASYEQVRRTQMRCTPASTS